MNLHLVHIFISLNYKSYWHENYFKKNMLLKMCPKLVFSSAHFFKFYFKCRTNIRIISCHYCHIILPKDKVPADRCLMYNINYGCRILAKHMLPYHNQIHHYSNHLEVNRKWKDKYLFMAFLHQKIIASINTGRLLQCIWRYTSWSASKFV